MTYNGVDQPGGRQEDQHPSMISPSGLLQGATCKMDVGEVYGNFHHISKLASKAILQFGILHHTKSFIGPLELQHTFKAFIHILWNMALSSTKAGWLTCLTPCTLDAVEIKAFKICGIFHDEAESMGLSISHHRQVGGLSVFYHLPSVLALFALSVLCHPPPRFLQRAHSSPSTSFQ